MKARSLNGAFPRVDDLAGYEDELRAAFEAVLEEAARRAGDRFETVVYGEALAAAAPTPQSAMVAVYPSPEQAAAIAQAGGEDADVLHCTLAFLGEIEPDQAEGVAAVVQRVASEFAGPLEGMIGGLAVFDDNGNGHPSIILPDVDGLAELRHAVCAALDEAGIFRATNHGWTPHLTLSYSEEPSPPPKWMLGRPLNFDSLSVSVGDVRRDFPLGDTFLAQLARAMAQPIGDAIPTVRIPAPDLGRISVRAAAEGLTAGAVVAESEKGVEIGQVAESHAPDGGYGDTAWNESTGTVYWVAADWSSNDEVDAAVADFLAIDGVTDVEHDAETGLPDGDDWEVVYSSAALSAAAPPPTWGQPHPDELVDVEALVAAFRTKANPVRLAVIQATAEKALEKAGLSFDATNRFIDAVYARVGQHITYIAETTRLNAMRIVRRSYEEGLSIPDTASAIRVGMEAAAGTRATLIARTEMTSLVNGSSLAATKIVDDEVTSSGEGPDDGGGAYMKRWLTAPGASFPRHEDYEGLDGQTIPLEATFDVGGAPLQYPGDPDGPPDEVCNCRCTLVYIDRGGGETEGEDLAASAAGLPSQEVEEGGDVRGRSAGIQLAAVEEEALAEETQVEPAGECANCGHMADDHAGPDNAGACSADDCSCEAFEMRADEAAVEGMTAFVRLRPDSTEFHARVATAVGEGVANALADLEVVPSDVRPDRTPGVEIVEAEAPTGGAQQRWNAIFAPEGKATDDGRVFAPDSCSWRELPLSLMAMTVTSEGGHIGAELAGRIDRIWRDESAMPWLIRAEGVFNDNAYGNEIANLVRDGALRGNSVDLAIRRAEYGPRDLYVDENGLWKDDAPADGAETDDEILGLLLEGEDVLMVFRDAVIGMSTVCPFPAFEEGTITLTAGGELAPDFAIVEHVPMKMTIWMEDSVEAAGDVVTASAAGIAPVRPPTEWFDAPELEELTPLTVDDDGRIFGHAWQWDSCHIGIPGACTVAPHSETDYAYFHLKEVECDDGSIVAVGTITLGTGHADTRASRRAATEHYDNTGAAVADVRIYEDEFGGVVAGALRPEVSEERVRELRGSSPSGDWRRVEGNLELVGLLAVNVPGFPVPRTKALMAAAEGTEELEVLALVAAGVPERASVPEVEFLDASDLATLRALAARAEGGLAGLAELAAAPRVPEETAPASYNYFAVKAALTAAGADPDVGRTSTTYELTQGSLAHRKFLSEAIASGFTEMSSAEWPCEADVGDHGEILFSDKGVRVSRLEDGRIVLLSIRGGWAQVNVAAPTRDGAGETIAEFSNSYPAIYREMAENEFVVPITFWTNGQWGPTSRLRMIDSAKWDEIGGNYSATVRAELEKLMDGFEPGKNGQLLIWDGPPGTGKTWALRALASQWSDWAEFNYITDPDAFFVTDPAYMIDVLLHGSYEELVVSGDGDTDLVTTAGDKWRVLILEDTGELLAADAKDSQGQGLSRLLNVVDGMVGQGLRILALLTTNDELEGFHPAATRPGRCASQITFGSLDTVEAQTWLAEHSQTAEIEGPATLAELYALAGGADDAIPEEIAEIADSEPAAE